MLATFSQRWPKKAANMSAKKKLGRIFGVMLVTLANSLLCFVGTVSLFHDIILLNRIFYLSKRMFDGSFESTDPSMLLKMSNFATILIMTEELILQMPFSR